MGPENSNFEQEKGQILFHYTKFTKQIRLFVKKHYSVLFSVGV